MTTLFVNRLTVIDCSFLDPDSGLTGESWLVDVELDGSLDDQGMVLDFGEVKRQVKRTIDESFDHRLLVPTGYSGCIVAHGGEQFEVRFRLKDGAVLRHAGPVDATALIDAERIDAGTVAEAARARLQPLLPANVEALRLRLYTETPPGAWYRYSHGLRQHGGNCQRIAHGHRSRILIYRDGVRDPALELAWAKRWRDIYIGSGDDMRQRFEQDGVPFMRFGYHADQGDFDLELPAGACYLIDTDSTVENLAAHIAATLKREHPASSFRVLAYEGVDKGAVGTA
jgi:hypothetical protein